MCKGNISLNKPYYKVLVNHLPAVILATAGLVINNTLYKVYKRDRIWSSYKWYHISKINNCLESLLIKTCDSKLYLFYNMISYL